MRKLGIIFICLAQFVSNAVAQPKTVAYRSDSVTFKNVSGDISFGGTLTLPVIKKACAAVILVSGTGPQDRDGTMAGHKIFATIADYLSARGIAVLRTDDRGVGKTTGEYRTSTTKNFADDALAAVNYLRTRKEIDTGKIGLLGHSEGGAAIAIAAAQSNKVKFLISVAGLAMNGYDALILQNEELVKASAFTDSDKERINGINRLMFKTAFEYADSANMADELKETYLAWKKKDSIAVQSKPNPQADHFRFPYYNYILQATGPWYRYFVKYDAKKVMSRIKVPVLALNGDQDLMVSYKQNLENWRTFPLENGNRKVTTVVMPGLNHLFLLCKECSIKEYPNLKSDFSPEALAIIMKWLQKEIL